MSYRALYAYGWDILDAGVDAFVDEVGALGIDTVSFAGAYHAGKFLRPHGRSGKVYFPDDGTVAFRHEPSRFHDIQPIANSMLGERDVLGDLTENGKVAVNAWMVLLHNSRLGALHPQATVRNPFGDPYVYSLCPSAPAVRDYAVALCGNVADSYPVTGLTLETPGFLPYVHGYHHEFALVRPNRWLESMLGLCFCRHCVSGAGAAGIDAAGLRARVAADIEALLGGDCDVPDDMAEAFWLADLQADGALSAFLRWRCEVVTSLVAAIRAAVRPDATVAVIPSVARPTAGAWYEGSDIAALAEAAGIVEACFYEPGVERIRADIRDVQRRMNGHGKLRGILRPSFPDLQSRGEVIAAAEALRDAGVTEIAFYNYGHLPRRNLAWIADALAAFGA